MRYLETAMTYRSALTEDLRNLIAIPSVKGPALPGMPYGRGCYDAVAYMLRRAEEMGFETGWADGHMGWADYGDGEHVLAIISHLDVVPAGDGWHYPPYCGTLVDGELMYGRGSSDNKGAGVAALYTLQALKDLGITGNMRIRALFGSDEESGMNDIQHYIDRVGMPDVALVPDAAYPIYNRQRGGLRCAFSWGGDTGAVLSVSAPAGSEATRARVRLTDTDVTLSRLFSLSQHLREDTPSHHTRLLIAEHGPDEAELTAIGGENPLYFLLTTLCELFQGKLGELLPQLASSFTQSGESALPALPQLPDNDFGSLFISLTGLTLENGGGEFTVYMRVPANGDVASHKSALIGYFPGCVYREVTRWESHYVPEAHPATRLLAKSYEEETGEPARYLCNFGGNYSRYIDAGFAYGAGLPGDPPSHAHGPDERVNIDSLLRHMALHIAAAERFMREYIPPQK